MDPILFLSFLAATFVIVATPGPAVALASSQAVRFGPRAAMTTVAGDALGSAVHIIIAVASLQTLIGLSELILPWLQIVGGVFILWMAWRSIRRVGAHIEQATVTRATFFAGFFSCVTNPKAIVFFVALFPGFISQDHSVLVQSLIYGVVFITLDAACITGYALLARQAYTRANPQRIPVEWISGLGLFGVGVGLIFKGWRALPANS